MKDKEEQSQKRKREEQVQQKVKLLNKLSKKIKKIQKAVAGGDFTQAPELPALKAKLEKKKKIQKQKEQKAKEKKEQKAKEQKKKKQKEKKQKVKKEKEAIVQKDETEEAEHSDSGSDSDSESESELIIKKSGATAVAAEASGASKSQENVQANPAPVASDGPTRVCVANLSYDINEEKLRKAFSSCGELVDIQWMFEKGSQKFYGKVFVQFDTPVGAEKAVAMNGKKVMGRPVRTELARHQGQSATKLAPSIFKPGGEGKVTALSEKPEGCMTAFMGNLSYDITEEALKNFFAECKFRGGSGAGMVDIRWLTHQDTGDFKGCCFLQFEDTTDVDTAVQLNGKPLLGRSVRMDYG